MTNEFKVGDKVRIVTPISGYPYQAGDIGTVNSKYSAFLYLVRFDGYGEQGVHPNEMELVEPSVENMKPGEWREVPSDWLPSQAKRYNSGKAPLSYILLWPLAIEALANVCRKGEEKYEKFNYKKGAPISQYMDSGLRHQKAFVNGEDLDTETQCHHLAMDIWNKMQALEVMLTPEMKEKFDDRYKKT